MKSKKLLLLVAMCACAAVLGKPVMTQAAEGQYGGSANGIGKIKFIENEDGGKDEDGNNTTDPGEDGKNPGDGGQLIPSYPEGPGGSTKGPLRLRFVPNMSFGENKISFKEQNYFAEFSQYKNEAGETVTRPSHVEIVDERGGSKGWNLSVSNNGVFTSDKNSTFNARISFNNLGIVSNSGFMKPDDEGKFPVVSTGTEADSYIEIKDGPTQLVKATPGQGTAGWSLVLGDTNKKTSGLGFDGNQADGTLDETKVNRNPAIKLNVPNKQIINNDEVYQTTLTWLLQSAD